MKSALRDSIEACRELKARGGTPSEACELAANFALDPLDTIRMLRSVFDLSFQQAKEILEVRDGNELSPLLSINSHRALTEYLTAELGYLGNDAYQAAINVLRDALQAVADRWQAATSDRNRLADAQMKLEDLIAMPTHPGIATWFLYFLDSKGLIGHAFRVSHCWLERKGRLLLDALIKYGDEPTAESPLQDSL